MAFKYDYKHTVIEKCIIHKQTDNAVLLSADLANCEDVGPELNMIIDKKWFPKSRIEIIQTGDTWSVSMPRWLVTKNAEKSDTKKPPVAFPDKM